MCEANCRPLLADDILDGLRGQPSRRQVSKPTASGLRGRIATVLGAAASEIRAAAVSMAPLFFVSRRKATLVLSAVWFLLSFGAYGLSMWLPVYYQHGCVLRGPFSRGSQPSLVHSCACVASYPRVPNPL